eukprot:TRINITY_DN9945_c0_g1_i1.p1 TRINITY_DN9945_c0_g1~~TRINITY_DN9945_c0_g1_i1.p1  ORF type:complete len:218 (+),score=25.18 TRINITY_DN9945_c0_g1_i1:38-655(+)
MQRREFYVGKQSDDASATPYFWKRSDLTGVTAGSKAVILDATSAEYQFVTNAFKQTTQKTIISIEYIVNLPKWESFRGVFRGFRQQLGKDKVNNRYLWHGTDMATINKICDGGFLRDFTSVHVFGKGVYFARDSSYSAHQRYSPRDRKGYLGRMIYAIVLLGESTLGRSDMVRPPYKPGTQIEYESLVNNAADPSVFVATGDHQA